MVSEIAESMEQQTVGSKSINESLHEMNDSTDEVIQAVNEMSVGSKAILEEVQSLHQSNIFRNFIYGSVILAVITN